MSDKNDNKKSDTVKSIVLDAVKVAGRKAFFETNEYISKRLVPGQYHQYGQLAAVSSADLRVHIDERVKSSQIAAKLSQLVKEGVLLKKKEGRVSVYWLATADYLQPQPA